MIQQLLRNGNALKYSVKSIFADGSAERYILDFTSLGEFFDIELGSNAFLMHYNKFEKKWGLLKCRTGKYILLSEECLYYPQAPTYLLLPKEESPKALIRGVILYHDTPHNNSMIPPTLLKVTGEQLKEEESIQEGTYLVESER